MKTGLQEEVPKAIVVSCRQQKGGLHFLIHSGSLCLLTEHRSVSVEMEAGLMEEGRATYLAKMAQEQSMGWS